MHFKTTREDYDKAVEATLRGDDLDKCCLLAQTIRRVIGLNCLVGCTSVTISGHRHYLENDVIDAITKFDMSFTNLRRPDAKQVRDGFTELEFDLPIEEEPHEVPAR